MTEGKIKARNLAKSTVPVQHFVLSAPHSSKSSDSILMWYTLAIDMKMLPWMSLSISCRWTVAPNCGQRLKKSTDSLQKIRKLMIYPNFNTYHTFELLMCWIRIWRRLRQELIRLAAPEVTPNLGRSSPRRVGPPGFEAYLLPGADFRRHCGILAS